MPWTSEDAPRFTKKANTEEKKRLWSNVANNIYSNTKNESLAIRKANAAVRDHEAIHEGAG